MSLDLEQRLIGMQADIDPPLIVGRDPSRPVMRWHGGKWRLAPWVISHFPWHLSGVVIEARDAMGVMSQHDSPETLHYVDPPYPHSTRSNLRSGGCYEFEMNDDQHRALAAFLLTLKGCVVLSGYENEIYSNILRDWRTVSRSAMADGARERTEILWLNFQSNKEML